MERLLKFQFQVNRSDKLKSKLRLHVFWTKKSKECIYWIPDNGQLVIKHPDHYNNRVNFEIAFSVGGGFTSHKFIVFLGDNWCETTTTDFKEVSADLKRSTVRVELKQIIATHKGFVIKPSGILSSIDTINPKSVENFSSVLVQWNNKHSDESPLSIKHITHVGWAYGTRDEIKKNMYYTVFYGS